MTVRELGDMTEPAANNDEFEEVCTILTILKHSCSERCLKKFNTEDDTESYKCRKVTNNEEVRRCNSEEGNGEVKGGKEVIGNKLLLMYLMKTQSFS